MNHSLVLFIGYVTVDVCIHNTYEIVVAQRVLVGLSALFVASEHCSLLHIYSYIHFEGVFVTSVLAS